MITIHHSTYTVEPLYNYGDHKKCRTFLYFGGEIIYIKVYVVGVSFNADVS